MAIRVGKGRASVLIEGALADGIEADIRKLLGPVVDEVQREADAILKNAVEHWPRDTDRSAEGWSTALQLMPERLSVEVALVNPVKYVRYIRSAKDGYKRGGRLVVPLQTLIKKPVREANKRLKKSLPAILGPYLEQALKGGDRG